MKSMTGYGRGSALLYLNHLNVELTSVNHKQLDIRMDLPPGCAFLGIELRRLVSSKIQRGSVVCRVFMTPVHAVSDSLAVDKTEIADSLRKLRGLAKSLKLEDDLRASHLLVLSNSLRARTVDAEPDVVVTAAKRALTQALKALNEMRLLEGEALLSDLNSRLKQIKVAVQRIAARAPLVAKQSENQLKRKINAWQADLSSVNPERLEREIVAAVLRSDITEELTRLSSHLAQMEQSFAARQPVGRLLDFLAQEILREINTIAAKAGDLTIAKLVVKCKTELERVREQIQNIE